MQRTPAIQGKVTVLTQAMATTMQNIAGQLVPSSRKTYTIDAKHFAQWIAIQDLSLSSLNRDDLVAYRTHLAQTYAQSTAARMWAVVKRLLDEAVQRGLLSKSPAEGIRGFQAGDDESPHCALKREEARAFSQRRSCSGEAVSSQPGRTYRQTARMLSGPRCLHKGCRRVSSP